MAITALSGAGFSAVAAQQMPAASAGTSAAGTTSAVAGTASATSAAGQTAPVQEKDLQKALEELKSAIKPPASDNLSFSIDQDSGRTVVKVVDTQTDQVIRQIPSEEALEIAKDLDRMKGILVKGQA